MMGENIDIKAGSVIDDDEAEEYYINGVSDEVLPGESSDEKWNQAVERVKPLPQ